MTQPVKTWPAKDPQAVLDYTYDIPLDEGDSVASHTFEKLSGEVIVDSQSRSGAEVTAWLSGGTDGETAMFRVAWVTTLTRIDDAIILLPVAANEIEALLLTGYAKPLPGHLIARYPAFADVPVTTIRAWLSDAERFVTTAWGESDYAAGLMSLAAHNMASAGMGTDGAALSGVPAGITRMKSGSLELGFTPEAANARLSGGLGSTRYGIEYQTLLRANRAGPYVAPTGVPLDGGYDGRVPSWGY